MNNKQPEGNHGRTYIGACIAIGIGVGAALGVALNHMPIGVGVGAVAGIIFGAIFEAKRKKGHSDSSSE